MSVVLLSGLPEELADIESCQNPYLGLAAFPKISFSKVIETHTRSEIKMVAKIFVLATLALW